MGHLVEATDRWTLVVSDEWLSKLGRIPVQAAVTGQQVDWTDQLCSMAKPGICPGLAGP